MFAVMIVNVEAVHELLSVEAGIRDNDGNTALIKYVQHPNYLLYKPISRADRTFRILNMLLVEAKVKNNDGKTALMFAIDKHNTTLVRMLLSEARMQDNNGNTALMMACSKKYD